MNGRTTFGILSIAAILLATTTATQAQTCDYDQAGRLISVAYDDGSSITYRYDANGNLLERVSRAAMTGVAAEATTGEGSGLAIGPNPMNEETTIRIDNAGHPGGELRIADVEGRTVRTIMLRPGMTEVRWDGGDELGRLVPSGLYTVEVRSDDGSLLAGGRVVLLR